MTRQRRRPSVGSDRHPGWPVVAAFFVILTVGSGLGFYGLSSFSRDLVLRNGFSLPQTAIGATVFLLASGVGGLLVAYGMRRMGPRLLLSAGIALMATYLATVGLARQPWTLWALFAVGGIAFASLSLVPAAGVIVEWFGNASAAPLALVTTGISVGGVVITPGLDAFVVAQGLRTAGLIIAGLMCLLLLPLLWVIRNPPASAVVPSAGLVGPGATTTTADPLPELLPRSSDPATTAPKLPDPGSPTRRRVIPVGLGLALVSTAFALMFLSQVSVITTMITIVTERGFARGSLALSALATASVLGRLGGVPLLRRVGLRRMSLGVAALQAISMWLFAVAGSFPALVAAVVLLGITVGNAIVLLPLWVLHVGGRPRFATLFSRANLWTTMGTAAAPLVFAGLHGLTGSFAVPLAVLGAGSAAAGLMLAVLPRVPASQTSPAPQVAV